MSNKIVFILDRSGSMFNLQKDVIGGFNSFLSEQKKLKDKAEVTTILFDHYYEVLHDDIDINRVEPITERQYYTRGNTALLDAIGKTIKNIDVATKKRDNVLFVINTDGYENASTEYNNKQVKELVEHFEKKHDWKFIFLGANMDAFSVGSTMGITYNFNYANTKDGIHTMYAAVSDTTRSWRTMNSSAGGGGGGTFDTTQLSNMDKEVKDNSSS